MFSQFSASGEPLCASAIFSAACSPVPPGVEMRGSSPIDANFKRIPSGLPVIWEQSGTIGGTPAYPFPYADFPLLMLEPRLDYFRLADKPPGSGLGSLTVNLDLKLA
jgi:hypothetical protein